MRGLLCCVGQKPEWPIDFKHVEPQETHVHTLTHTHMHSGSLGGSDSVRFSQSLSHLPCLSFKLCSAFSLNACWAAGLPRQNDSLRWWGEGMNISLWDQQVQLHCPFISQVSSELSCALYNQQNGHEMRNIISSSPLLGCQNIDRPFLQFSFGSFDV